jgi:hypothetical protein
VTELDPHRTPRSGRRTPSRSYRGPGGSGSTGPLAAWAHAHAIGRRGPSGIRWHDRSSVPVERPDDVLARGIYLHAVQIIRADVMGVALAPNVDELACHPLGGRRVRCPQLRTRRRRWRRTSASLRATRSLVGSERETMVSTASEAGGSMCTIVHTASAVSPIGDIAPPVSEGRCAQLRARRRRVSVASGGRANDRSRVCPGAQKLSECRTAARVDADRGACVLSVRVLRAVPGQAWTPVSRGANPGCPAYSPVQDPGGLHEYSRIPARRRGR